MVAFLVAYLAAPSYTAELWCVENDYKVRSEEIISDFMCRTDTNETIIQQCNRYNPPFSNCSHQSFKHSLERIKQFFNDDDYFNIKVSAPGPWDERFCYGSDRIFFKLNEKKQRFIINYIIDKHNSTEFWVPARSQNYNPAQWRIPGELWGEPVKVDYEELSPYDCVSVNVTMDLTPLVVMRNCSDNLPMLCVSRENPLIQAPCEVGSVALRIVPNQCYRIVRYRPHHLVENPDFSELLKNHAALYLASYSEMESNEMCLVHFNSSSNTAITLNNQGGLGTVNGLPRNLTCMIEMYSIPKLEEVEMYLSFEPSVESLILTVYNRRGIWCDQSQPDDKRDDRENSECGIRCFTNADYEQLQPVKIKQLVWEDSKKSIYELKLYGDGPGYYWCEAHSIFDFELISSPKIIAAKKQKGHYFAFFFNLPCKFVRCDRINANMKTYGKTIRMLLNNIRNTHGNVGNFKDLDIHNVRVMSIESLEPGVHLTVLCHAAVSLKGSSVDNSSEEDDSEYIEGVKDDFDRDVQVRAHMRRLLSNMLAISPYGVTNVVNSTNYCFSETSASINRTWQPAEIGSSTTTYKLCLLRNGLPVFRKCIGDFLYGATWEPLDPRFKCATRITQQIITRDLYEIDRKKFAESQPTVALTSVETLVNTTQKIIPADLFYLGRIMQSVAKTIKSRVDRETSNKTEPTTQLNALNDTESIIRIYNSLMDVDRRVFKPAIKLNSTNILLDAFEKIFNTLSTRNDTIYSNDTHSSNHPEMGVIVYRSPKLITYIIDPSVSNYSGVALYTNDKSHDFRESKTRLLFANTSEYDLLDEDDLEIATFVPQSLLNRLDEIPAKINQTLLLDRPPLRIVLKIYYNDKLFQEDRDIVDNLVFSKIISVSIPGYNPALPEILPLFLKMFKTKSNVSSDSCRYWNYSTWADDGLEFLAKSSTDNDVVLCGCSHLTPFAYLVGGSYNLSVTADHVIITELHKEALDMITILGCSLSLVGITGIVITAIIFDKWREKPTSKVVLNFSIAIAFQMILFCFVNTELLTVHLLENQIFSSCIILGACLHYSVLVQFSWMLIIAYLQFKRYVQVLGNTRPPRFFIKAFILGWCIPIVPVAAVLIIDMHSYIPIDNRDESQICYPSGQALYFGVILPIAAIIIANLIIFLLVLYNIVRGPKEKIRSVDRSSALSQIRLSILLFFLLGFTWIFGLLAAAKISLVFSYLFCLTATLQGFVMFIYFIILDPVTRSMWSTFIKGLCCGQNNK